MFKGAIAGRKDMLSLNIELRLNRIQCDLVTIDPSNNDSLDTAHDNPSDRPPKTIEGQSKMTAGATYTRIVVKKVYIPSAGGMWLMATHH